MSDIHNSDRVVLVAGATGKQGGAVARCLLDEGFRVRAFTRDPHKPEAQALAEEGAELARGDLDDPTTLERDFWRFAYAHLRSYSLPISSRRAGSTAA